MDDQLRELAEATCTKSYRGGPLLYTNPPGVSLNRLVEETDAIKFSRKIFLRLTKKNVLGKTFA
jgi:hypothetical protein